MQVAVANHQRQTRVNLAGMRRLARRAVRHLRIRQRGTFAIAFVDSDTLRKLNKQFKHHDRDTDVLSFRYDGEALVGEVLISPRQARRYAAAHGVPYTEELSRYVVHGLLHWLGHEDRTRTQQAKMRRMEDRLLGSCSVVNPSAR